MAKLSTKARNSLPAAKFGDPKDRAYPMPDKAHARNAKARASEEYNKGNISGELKAHIDRMADRVLAK